MKKPIYKKWWFWVILVIVIGGIGNMGKDTEATDQATPTATVEPAKEVVAEVVAPTIEPTVAPTVAPTEQPIPGTIGMTPDEFTKSFNDKSEEIKAQLKIKKLTIENGSVQNVFQYKFTNNLGMTGSVNKVDGSVRDVLLIGTSDGTASSVSDVLIGMGILVLATNPDLPTSETSNILNEFGLLDEGVDIFEINKSVVKNGISYHFQASKELGIMFSASDANEK